MFLNLDNGNRKILWNLNVIKPKTGFAMPKFLYKPISNINSLFLTISKVKDLKNLLKFQNGSEALLTKTLNFL